MSTSASRTDTDDAPVEEAPSGPGAALVDESRRVLVHLLQGPFLDGRRDGSRYAQLLRDRAGIEARLADLFLELVVDDDAQVAFVRQSEEDPDAPKLLRRLTGMNRLDSVLMLVLRGQGERQEVLLGRKLTGFGAGNMVAPGGKIEPGEQAAAAAIRELEEETGLQVTEGAPVHRATILFRFPVRPASDMDCQVFLATSYQGELWLEGVHIPEYINGNWTNHAAHRRRKLLLHREQIDKLVAKAEQAGHTIVPLSLYFKDGRAKVEIALAKGKKLHDKRQALRERQDRREAERAMSAHLKRHG